MNLLSLSVSDPPLHSEVQDIATKVDELIHALRRRQWDKVTDAPLIHWLACLLAAPSFQARAAA